MDEVFIISSLANFSAAYNLTITGHILLLIGLSGYPPTDLEESYVASAAILGAITGQTLFGFLGQRCLSIKVGLALSLLLCSAGNLLAAFFSWHPVLFQTLATFRFLSGVGAGGVYPLSSNATAQTSTDKSGVGRRVMLVFSFQGIGQIASPLTVVLLDSILPYAPSASWRLALILGAIPPAYGASIALNSAPGTALNPLNASEIHGTNRGPSDSALSADAFHINDRRGVFTLSNLCLLVGTAGSWFVFDLVFYGNIIFTPFMLEKVFGFEEDHPNEITIAGYNCLIMLLAFPGLLLASKYSDKLGRKKIQLTGFCMITALFFVLSLTYASLSSIILFVLYMLTFFFYNFGPNATTFVLPTETFPANCRVLFSGISAASGKIGAFIGASLFAWVLDYGGLGWVLTCCFIIGIVGVLLTAGFVKDMRGHEVLEESMMTELVSAHPPDISREDNSRSKNREALELG